MTTFSDQVFQYGGVPVSSGGNVPMITGNAWFVSSVSGSDGNSGKKPNQPFSTLAGAISNATTNNNDIIYLMEGHAETISASTAINKAGVQIVGLGTGLRRPLFTMSAAASSFAISVDNVSFVNVQFVGSFATTFTVALFTITTAKYFTVNNCSIRDTDSTHGFITLFTTNSTSNDADGLTITNNDIELLIATGAGKLVAITGTNDRIFIANNYYRTPTTGTGAPIVISTGKIVTNAQILWNRFILVQTTGTLTGVMLTTDGSTNTGMIANNYVKSLATIANPVLLLTASSGLNTFENRYNAVANKSGMLFPAVDS